MFLPLSKSSYEWKHSLAYKEDLIYVTPYIYEKKEEREIIKIKSLFYYIYQYIYGVM